MNKNPIMVRALFALAYIWIILLMAGCAAKPRGAGIVMEPAEKEELLRQRVQEMWHAQANGDRATMYEYYDPFFRARVKKGSFADREIPIHYYNVVIDSVEIKGNVATVRVSMEYEVKGLPGRLAPIDVPRKATIDHETWLFVDGNWYRQYIDYSSEGTFAKY
ncbi:MAG: nuclear transport factor 2 family protein [Dissulfuribacterales bacterium]